MSGSSSAGSIAVEGSWLPPDISAVLASGGVASSPLNGGANTVSGNGTERSSPASALVSVPAQGVAPSGTPGTGAAGGGVDGGPAAPTGTPPCVSGSAPAPDTPPPSDPETDPDPEPEAEAEAESAPPSPPSRP
ncbi:hypothetical protein ACM01_22415 [Streptomyces viridochromogenes]|uniref:Uncharacterized protein n=1 Tax=Streptomyces viridochromogenes TaxID=1938 RepID=A0A0J7Z8T7_STRVR|nr:hypothetical protein ACM01_22415 [Streptomyces viridochromogenes]KOG19567.1 hypothetical protein ADK36_18690 [Streptomyces viridochromogenes]KOG23077.1 hypothetical protein ADK35_14570 [Streptomyces viridochromogenes]